MRRRYLFYLPAVGLSLAFALWWLLGGAPALVAGVPAPPAQAAPRDVVTPAALLPLVARDHTASLAVNPQDRQASLAFFNRVYRASEGVPVEWTGNHAGCDEGSTSEAFRQAVVLRINYFRAMAGVPANVLLSDEYTRKAQKAALMMSVNRQLSHDPPSGWECWSEEGAEAAGRSNLFLGVYGVPAIDGYVCDPGGGNYFVGHRRWILYPRTRKMGTGDIPPAAGYPPANALWVLDYPWGPRPETREEYVAWPPPGYVPYQVVFPRWSFSYDGADFSSTSVVMASEGHSIGVSVQPVVYNYGENTLVWEPDLEFGTAPSADTVYSVTVMEVRIGGTSQDFVYDVIVFNPDAGSGAAFDGAGEWDLGKPPEDRW